MVSEFIQNDALFRVCVDITDNGTIRGRVYNHRLDGAIYFWDINEFFSALDAFMDENKQPQAFQQKRTFKSVKQPRHIFRFRPEGDFSGLENIEAGQKADYILYIYTRQNAGWQGFIRAASADDSERNEFESELELVRYMSAAV